MLSFVLLVSLFLFISGRKRVDDFLTEETDDRIAVGELVVLVSGIFDERRGEALLAVKRRVRHVVEEEGVAIDSVDTTADDALLGLGLEGDVEVGTEDGAEALEKIGLLDNVVGPHRGEEPRLVLRGLLASPDDSLVVALIWAMVPAAAVLTEAWCVLITPDTDARIPAILEDSLSPHILLAAELHHGIP